METTLCKIRDIHRSIAEFEARFEYTHNLCMNEGMVLCSLSKTKRLSSGEISKILGLTSSNTSKVIKSVENKGLIERVLGENDKRQMYFSLTESGKKRIASIKCTVIEMSDLLRKNVSDSH